MDTAVEPRLAVVEAPADPVRDLTALGAAYAGSALANPDLYRIMFDAAAELADVGAADRTFEVLVGSVDRARDAARFSENLCPTKSSPRSSGSRGTGSRCWSSPASWRFEALDLHAPAIATALFVAAGDDEKRCRRSVHAGWSSPKHALGAVP